MSKIILEKAQGFYTILGGIFSAFFDLQIMELRKCIEKKEKF